MTSALRRASNGESRHGGALNRLRVSAIVIVSAVYLLQCVSPMRLSEDAVRYLLIADSIGNGKLVAINGVPPGYPAFVALLDAMHIATSSTLNFANCVFLAVSLLALKNLFDARQRGTGNVVILITLMSWLIIRMTPTPVAEPMYFAFSFGSIYLMERSTLQTESGRRIILLAGAAVTTAIAIATRVAGVALIPSLAIVAFGSLRTASPKTNGSVLKTSWVTLVLVLAILTTGALLLTGSLPKYPKELVFTYFNGGFLQRVTGHVLAFFSTFGSVAINLPLTRYHGLITVLAAAGVAASIAIVRILKPRLPHSPLGIYLLSSLIVLALWPSTADRLWAPLIPVITGYLLIAIARSENATWAVAKRIYLAWFFLTGAAALAYSTRITLSGNEFARTYGRAGGNSVGFSKTTGFGEWNDSMVVMLRRKYERF